MDIKSRNFKYSLVMKVIAVFLIWVSFSGLFAAAVFFAKYSNQIEQQRYDQTFDFGYQFRDYVRYAAELVDLQGQEQALTKNNMPAQDQGMISAQDPIQDQAQIQDNTQTQEQTKEPTKEQILQQEKEQTAAETMEKTGAGQAEAEILLMKMEAQKRKNEKILAESVNFNYLIKNEITGSVVTNMVKVSSDSEEEIIRELKSKRMYVMMKEGHLYISEDRFIGLMNAGIIGPSITLYAAVEDEPAAGDIFYNMKMEFEKVHSLIPVFIVIAVFAILLGIVSFIYLTAVAGRKEKNGAVNPALIDWLYNDIHTAVLIFAAVISVGVAEEVVGHIFSSDPYRIIGVFVILSIDLLIFLSYALSMIRHVKRKTLFKHTLIYSSIRTATNILKMCFSARRFKPAVILLLLAYAAINSFVFAIMTHEDNGGLILFTICILLALNIAAIYYVSRALAGLSGIMKWVKQMTKGNLEVALKSDKMSPAFAEFAADIGSLQEGIRCAVAEAVKGEKLKTELITNVSHDLKTPLTSIINYVDLLKKEKIENETVNEYVGILENKSARLKQLVEDLLEASKAASGDMTVSFASVDLCALAQQAEAEYGEKAAEAGLDVRVKMCDKPVIVCGDGSLMWRIMDNLLSNVVKYSQKNSRVYMDVEESGAFGRIIVRNISEAPLDISSDQLMERFVRGDSSRTTEGSGLGLSIAKSLAEIQRGTLELKIDGDLFKVIVSIPLEAVKAV